MHSSIINKIRILKPRKRPNSSTRSFTITNSNCHSSLTPKEAVDDPPPPLIPQTASSVEAEEPAVSQWVPVYILDVPKVVKGTEIDTINVQRVSPSNESIQSSLNSECLSTSIVNVQVSKDVMEGGDSSSSNKTGDKSVSCFLCPSKFATVQAMQDHYLENHKKSKRALGFKKNGKSSYDTPGEESDATEEGEPKCPICSIGFKTKEEVQEHMGSVHCYDCSECKNTFYTLFQFTDHKCVKVIRPKRPKIKKKKVMERDPLAILPGEKEIQTNNAVTQTKLPEPLKEISFPVNTKAQNIVTAPPTQSPYPLVIPRSLQVSSNQGTYPTFIISKNQNDLLRVSNIYTTPVPSLGSNWNKPTLQNNNKNDMSHYTLEELTSKEVIRKKLDEILNNPSISLRRLSKDNLETNQEFFSCGRCNVLCEDQLDFLDHLEECLRLSNVSILPSSGTAKRLLKLRSELISSQAFSLLGKKASINKSLLRELKNFIDHSDILDSLDKTESFVKIQGQDKCGGNFEGVKLNESVSIKRVARAKETTMDEQNKTAPLLVSSKNYLQNRNVLHNNYGKQPMVIIPINKDYNDVMDFREKRPVLKIEDSEDHYPDISITDKSNSVTYKFAGSGMESILSMVDPPQNSSLVRDNQSKMQSAFHHPPTNVQGQEAQTSTSHRVRTKKVFVPLFQMPSNSGIPLSISALAMPSKTGDELNDPHFELKEEPLSPNRYCVDSDSLNGMDFFKNEFSQTSPIELVLDNEDIKMEIEDEVVDDKF